MLSRHDASMGTTFSDNHTPQELRTLTHLLTLIHFPSLDLTHLLTMIHFPSLEI
jgi:hypothetical protein